MPGDALSHYNASVFRDKVLNKHTLYMYVVLVILPLMGWASGISAFMAIKYEYANFVELNHMHPHWILIRLFRVI